jgi:hypothetical protein
LERRRVTDRIKSVLALWFTLERSVSPRAYASSGCGLMLSKYAVDAAFVYWVAGILWTPLDYLHPLLGLRLEALEKGNEWALGVLLVWTLPFVWIGAVRYCEFSTGPFVEPITAWEEARRLAFDVRSQPEPMHEWSPYQTLHAPHLLDGLQSRRGEFRLSALPGGRTRLEGTTWYTLDMFPQSYWTLWSDPLIASIHRRVLEHIDALASP